jgi:hypothetical protein
MYYLRFTTLFCLLILLSGFTLAQIQTTAAQSGVDSLLVTATATLTNTPNPTSTQINTPTPDGPTPTPPNGTTTPIPSGCNQSPSSQSMRHGSALDVTNLDAPIQISPQRSLAAMLNADGTLDLSSGFSGTLDANGWQMTTNDNGAPRFSPAGLSVAGDENWDGRFGKPGISGSYGDKIYAIAIDGQDVYIGGTFSKVGGDLSANNIVRWDGERFSALGSGVQGGSYDSAVYAIHIQGDTVYVAGKFTQAGTIAAKSIAKWNKNNGQWMHVGNGVGPQVDGYDDPSINALTTIGNDLYVGGVFTTIDSLPAFGIARFNLTTSVWSPLGCGLGQTNYNSVVAGKVHAFAASATGKLYVGGEFALASNGNSTAIPVAGIAEWNTTTQQWAALGSLINCDCSKTVTAVTLHDHLLYMATKIEQDYQDSYVIDQWDTTTRQWSRITDQLGDRYAKIDTLAVYSGSLYVGGVFNVIGGIAANNLARYELTNRSWSAIGGNIKNGYSDGSIATLATGNQHLYIGGEFETIGDQVFYHLAAFDGVTLAAFGKGVLQYSYSGIDGVYAMAVHDKSGLAFIGGEFSHIGEQAAKNIALWDGTAWKTIGNADKPVWAMAIYRDDLYVGGEFTTIGGITANHIARWNLIEQKWYALGGGVNGDVYALSFAPDGTLYASGKFSNAGNAAGAVALWDTTKNTWSAIEVSFYYDTSNCLFSNHDCVVWALAAETDGVTIGGGFDGVCVDASCSRYYPVNHILYWHRATNKLLKLGDGVNGKVFALALAEDGLYVGGDFERAGTSAAHDIAKMDWDGNWSGLGNGIGGCTDYLSIGVRSLYVAGKDVYVGGCFSNAGSATANNIARWNIQTQEWAAFGSGLQVRFAGGIFPSRHKDGVKAITAYSTTLYAGGSIIKAGENPSYGIALWTLPEPVPSVTPMPTAMPTLTPTTIVTPTTQPTDPATPAATQTPIPTATHAPKLNAQSTTTGAPGSRFVFTGEGFPPNQQVSVSLLKTEISAADSTQSLTSTIQSDANGRVSFTLITPATLAAGNYLLAVGTVSTSITIDTSAPLQQPTPQGESVTVEVIELLLRAFLPLVTR